MNCRSALNGLVAIPVYNEAESLQRVVDDLCATFPSKNLLFIDDGSTDGSHAILERAGLGYLRHPINLGYEESLRTAMREALEGDHEYVVFFDGDGQHRIEDLQRLIQAYEQDRSDLVLGSRYREADQPPLSLRSVTTRTFSLLTTLLAGVRITDVTCGLKLISRRYIPVALKLPTEDMHAELIVGLARCGARIRELKVTIRPREAGTSMYHLYKGLFYPAKTVVCLLGQMIFYPRLKSVVGPVPKPRPDARANG